MNPAQLLAQFDRLVDTPDAIPRLRRLILDLAVRGKLVEQDPIDEPARELLKRIHAEKARQVKEVTHRKQTPLPPMSDEDRQFRLPTNWIWTQLAEIGFINPRNNAEGTRSASFIPMTLIPADYGLPAKHEVRPWGEIKSGFTHFADGDVALAKITPCFQNGKSTVLRDLTGGIGAGTTELHVVRPVFVNPDYTLIFLKSPHFIESGVPLMTGTAGQKRVGTSYFANSPFPLPPLTEQCRIVARVDELMTLCDRLEAAQAERKRRRDRLTAASLQRLNQPANDATAFREDVRFHLRHLPCFTILPDQIPGLRQAIHNLAVRGRLVPQARSDQPPPSFNIAEDGDAKDRLELTLPFGWRWARVNHVAQSRLGKMLDKAKNSGKPYRYLRNTNIHWFDIRMDELKTMRIEDSEVESFLLWKGDVLICEGGHGIGRTSVWRADKGDVVFQKALHRVRPGQFLDSEFFAQCVFVYFHSGILQAYYTGVGIPHFTGVALSKLVFPLPPLAEQHRIVAKVNELMAVCDQLESQLTTAQTERRRLLEAVLHEALAPAAGG